jgi:hypothetical protein
MSLPTPYAGTAQPGIARTDLTSVTVSTSPADFAFQLPTQGIYLATVSAWFAGPHHRASGVFVLKWCAADVNWVRGADLLGAVDIAGNQISALTVSDPTTSGAFTVTVTSSAGNSEARAVVNLRLIASAGDQAVIG